MHGVDVWHRTHSRDDPVSEDVVSSETLGSDEDAVINPCLATAALASHSLLGKDRPSVRARFPNKC